MSFIIIDADQRSDAWRQARLGRLTGSRACDMLATRKDGKEAAGRINLRVQLVLERITGRSHESGYISAAMQQGIDREPDAVALYEALTGTLVQTTGFLAHTELMAGCSLDGHLGHFQGIVEVKSPIAATHLEYLKTGVVPTEYVKQIIHALWVSGASWCDWLSYNPEFPEPLQAKLVRVDRDDRAIEAYDRLARTFLAEVDREVADVLALLGAAA